METINYLEPLLLCGLATLISLSLVCLIGGDGW